VRILALSDEESAIAYDATIRERFHDIDLVVGCGDLPARYLEYVVTQLNVPLVFVPGNHDPDDIQVPGGQAIDGRIMKVRGIWVAGLGGSRRYKSQGRHQYREGEMRMRMSRMLPRLLFNARARGKGLHLFVTHSPPFGVHDAVDLPHVGFASFHTLLRLIRPTLMLHGHSHANRNLEVTETRLYGTRIINVYPYRVIELGDRS